MWVTWWRHQMEAFSALLAICAGNSPVPGEFPAQRPVTRSFDVFFDLRPNNGWVNNCEAGDLRRHRAHYDVIVMINDADSGLLPTGCWAIISINVDFSLIILHKMTFPQWQKYIYKSDMTIPTPLQLRSRFQSNQDGKAFLDSTKNWSRYSPDNTYKHSILALLIGPQDVVRYLRSTRAINTPHTAFTGPEGEYD